MMRFFSLIVALVLLSGCAASQQELAAKSLLVSKAAIVSTASSVDQLCSANALSQDQCDEASKVYSQAGISYDLAVASLMASVADDSEEAWSSYEAFHNQFAVLYVKFMQLAIDLGIVEVQQ